MSEITSSKSFLKTKNTSVEKNIKRRKPISRMNIKY